ncbi:unnamed protein product [Symbiodinium natans]|uniref:Uncharacterized protein n=1 Tax=Symbiodinium natans TaxID=878477 RepID=A0A812USY2_9DINO|nr:unnamed protein product [Symbiodinium natans]
MALSGCNKAWSQTSQFLQEEAKIELTAFFQDPRPEAVRVLVMRHAMGAHNTYAGMGSIVSEDAEINDCGKAQAEAVGDCLREAGVLPAFHMAVVSPFTRTLQTARAVLGPDIGAEEDEAEEERQARAQHYGYSPVSPKSPCRPTGRLPLVVSPLCAEQTFVHSHLGRGNRGTTSAMLLRRREFRIFDFRDVDTYCITRRVGASNTDHDGKWWHHGPHSEETASSFRRRAGRLKKWLGRLQITWGWPLNVLMITHGGIMQTAFNYQPHPPNCAFRVYDVGQDGRAWHVASEEVIESEFPLEPVFEVLSVVRLPTKVSGQTMHKLELSVGSEVFFTELSEIVLRDQLHAKVKDGFSEELYEKFKLSGLFPSWWSWLNRARGDLSIYIQDYLEQLALAMAEPGFPEDIYELVDKRLLEGRLRRLRESNQEPGSEAGCPSFQALAPCEGGRVEGARLGQLRSWSDPVLCEDGSAKAAGSACELPSPSKEGRADSEEAARERPSLLRPRSSSDPGLPQTQEMGAVSPLPRSSRDADAAGPPPVLDSTTEASGEEPPEPPEPPASEGDPGSSQDLPAEDGSPSEHCSLC